MEVIHQANEMLQKLNKEPSQHTQGLQISNSLQVQTNHTGVLTATHQAAANSTRCARQLPFSSNQHTQATGKNNPMQVQTTIPIQPSAHRQQQLHMGFTKTSA